MNCVTRETRTIEIAKLKKDGRDAGIEVTKAKGIDAEISEIEREVAVAEEEEKGFLMRLPNLLHESVPVVTMKAKMFKSEHGQTARVQISS